MKVHHLDCGPMHTVLGRLPAHVLLLEHDDGLVLVDTGFGLRDGQDPGRLGASRFLLRADLDPRHTAVRQLEQLGLQAADVRHVVLTHLDVDHAGGIADVPDAVVHTTATELLAATSPRLDETLRYRQVQWAHGPRWSTAGSGGETWRGFSGCTALLGGDVLLVPLPGHTRGHAAVAVRTGTDQWLLHAGDAYFHRGSISGGGAPLGLRAFEGLVAVDRGQVRANHERLRALADDPSVTVFCAHDPAELAELRGT